MTAAFFPAQDEVRQWLQDAAHIAMLTGAGVSAESGVPTFRDAQTGLWANFRAEDLATEAAFRRDPQRVWDWYAERRANMVHVQPNAGHHAVAAFQQRHPGRLTLATQNVDGLHQKAGSPEVLALHGNIFDDSGSTPARWRAARRTAVAWRRPSPATRRAARSAATCCARRWCGSARCCRWTRWPRPSRRPSAAT